MPFLGSLTIGGPFNASGPGDTPSRRKIFVCRPQSSDEETVCAKKILTELTKRAYRRPVTDADIETSLSFYQTALNPRRGFAVPTLASTRASKAPSASS